MANVPYHQTTEELPNSSSALILIKHLSTSYTSDYDQAAGIKKTYLEKANLLANSLVCLCRSFITVSGFTTS